MYYWWILYNILILALSIFVGYIVYKVYKESDTNQGGIPRNT